MSTEKKLTKKEILIAIRAEVAGKETVNGLPVEAVVDYIDTTISQIEAKAIKAKEKAAEKKADGDKLRTEVYDLVTSEWQTADAITAALDKEDISKAKVVARLTQLVNAGLVKKEQQKVGDSKLMCYALKDEAEVEEVAADAE